MRRFLPALSLFVLAPLMAEVLLGATPASNIMGLIIVGPLYGCGALLIREIIRWRQLGWGRLALLAAAYGIIEEGLAIQSLFNPNLFNAGLLGGQAWGVNWVGVEWTQGYHVLWSIILPIILTELLFPNSRHERWLGPISTTCIGIVYLAAAAAIAAIFQYVVAPDFQRPLLLNILTVGVVIALVILALRPTQHAPARVAEPQRNAPSPWLVAGLVLIAGAAWFGLQDLPQAVRHNALVLLPMLADLAVAGGVTLLIHTWSAADRRWTDLHRLAIIWGALPVSMAVGYFFVTSSNPFDQFWQGIASCVATVALAVVTWHVWRREQTQHIHIATPAAS